MTLAPYDAGWPGQFAAEAARLAVIFAGADAVIEHIGSTAVPGLLAKPVIDILVGVARLEEAERRVAAFEDAGYEYVPKYEVELPERRYFRKPRLAPRLYHVHCVVTHSPLWVRHLAFRDHLRAHPDCAAAYAALKQDLALQMGKEQYTDAKGPFIARVLAAALDDTWRDHA